MCVCVRGGVLEVVVWKERWRSRAGRAGKVMVGWRGNAGNELEGCKVGVGWMGGVGGRRVK